MLCYGSRKSILFYNSLEIKRCWGLIQGHGLHFFKVWAPLIFQHLSFSLVMAWVGIAGTCVATTYQTCLIYFFPPSYRSPISTLSVETLGEVQPVIKSKLPFLVLPVHDEGSGQTSCLRSQVFKTSEQLGAFCYCNGSTWILNKILRNSQGNVLKVSRNPKILKDLLIQSTLGFATSLRHRGRGR